MNLSLIHLCDFLDFCSRIPISSHLAKRSQFLYSAQHTPAAVLIGIAPNEMGEWHILMTRRAETMRHHTGQIAFAGGKRDPNDANIIATALRETHEETGIKSDLWHISGCLPECHTPSGFAITPILAWSETLPQTHHNPNEVAEIFWLPLDFALNLSHYTTRAHLPALPYLHYDIWGATALMLYYLAECWSAKSDSIFSKCDGKI